MTKLSYKHDKIVFYKKTILLQMRDKCAARTIIHLKNKANVCKKVSKLT